MYLAAIHFGHFSPFAVVTVEIQQKDAENENFPGTPISNY